MIIQIFKDSIRYFDAIDIVSVYQHLKVQESVIPICIYC
jgi:hypothetical protein